MTLETCVELWETINQGSKFWDAAFVNADIRRQALFDYLMFEFSDMETIDGNSEKFHNRVVNFFKIHKWNIDQLVATTLYEYEPLENYSWEQDRKLERDVGTKNVMDRETSDTSSWNENNTHKKDVDTSNVSGRETSDSSSWNENNTHKKDVDTSDVSGRETSENNATTTMRTTADNSTGSTVETENWTEQGKNDGSSINLLSAFNDLPATLDNLHDSEKDRTVTKDTYNKGGDKTDNINTTEAKTGTDNSTGTETKSGTDDKTETGTLEESYNQNTTGTKTTNGTDDKTETGTLEESYNQDTAGTKTTNGTDDKVDTGTLDEDVTEKIKRHGMNGSTYQQLIEEQRKTAEFNIYKWIGRHFCKELLIAVW